MGAWGTGFWSDDTTSDVRNSYMDGLKKKHPPEEVLAQLIDAYEMDTDDDGYLCWLAVALLQWEYGHLSEEVKARALDALHSGADEERWAEAPEKDRRKRREVLRQLEEKLLSTNEKPKKVRPYVRKRTKWKVGDVLSLRFGTMKPHQAEYLWPFQDLYGAALIVDFTEMDVVDIYVDPVVVFYDWVGASPAQKSELENTPFFRADVWLNNEPHLCWEADVPNKLNYSWWDLQVIAHLDTIPLSKEELEDRGPLLVGPHGWGNLGAAIAVHWLKTGREIPQRAAPEAETVSPAEAQNP